MHYFLYIRLVLYYFLCGFDFRTQTYSLRDTSSFLVKTASRQFYEAGIEYFVDGNFNLAVSALRQSFELTPNKYTAWELSRCYKTLSNRVEEEYWTIQFNNSPDNKFEDLIRAAKSFEILGDQTTATRHLEAALREQPHNLGAEFLHGLILQNMGDVLGAIDSFSKVLIAFPDSIKARLNVAALFQANGDAESAIIHYRYILEYLSSIPLNIINWELPIKAAANLGVAYYQLGLPLESLVILNSLYFNVSEVLKKSCHNSCVYLRHAVALKVASSADLMNCSWSITQPCVEHAGIALMHIAKTQKSVSDWAALELNIFGVLLPESLYSCIGISRSIFLPDRAVNDILQLKLNTPILPFDSLLLRISLRHRLILAAKKSIELFNGRPRIEDSETLGSVLKWASSSDKFVRPKLKLGFISYDFNDHPTAHLAEGIFLIVSKCRLLGKFSDKSCLEEIKKAVRNSGSAVSSVFDNVVTQIYNYGPNDSSAYRRRLETYADRFYDIQLLSHIESAKFIQQEGVDILLDMQLHTFGNRAEIISSHPAPIVINYLVYPGTSGSNVHDYIVSDKIVIPPEQSIHYTESMLIIPPSYQISTYSEMKLIESSDEISSYRMSDLNKSPQSKEDTNPDISESILYLCNFNKIDKIDSESFTVWMQILHRFPRSNLLLLDPSKTSDQEDSKIVGTKIINQNELSKLNLLRQTQYFGIESSMSSTADKETGDQAFFDTEYRNIKRRVSFAPRVSKSDHIKRQKTINLFLDTLVYGAHSTATDALRANLPVLTINGESFPNRVVASLYASFQDDFDDESQLLEKLLVSSSVKAFEDIAVELLKNPTCLKNLRNVLSSQIQNQRGIFNSELSTYYFLHGMKAVTDLKFLCKHNNKFCSKSPNSKRLISLAPFHVVVTTSRSNV